jgi:hypothetical protein
MGDGILLLGGGAFLILSGLSYFRPDLIWKLYSLEPRWRKDNPERTDKWDAKTQRYATYFLLIGILFIAFGFLI